MYLIIFGPPGSGKGTQAEKIVKKFGIPHISTGNIFREAVARKDELGKKAKEYMDKGELIPDAVVVGIVEERLRQKDCRKGFLLDGFPRTLPQAEALDLIIKRSGLELDGVINLEVDEEELVKRLTNRRICRSCGAIYHLIFSPPKMPGKCDRCEGEIYVRDDDREEAVRNRLKVYKLQTEPLIEYYRKRRILRDVDGNESIDEVAENINRILRF